MGLDLYHGSQNRIEKPQYGKGNRFNDYGRAFYTTENVDLAMEWAVEKDRSGYVNHYQIDTEDLSILDLSSNEYTFLHWLAILIENRSFDVISDFGNEAKKYILDNYLVDYESYDIIKGYRADDSYFSFAQDFLSNVISISTLSSAMRLGTLGEQIAIKSQHAFDKLSFIESIEADSNIWYPSKEHRDTIARKNYKELRSKPWKRGEIYIMTIIDEEIKPDDVRLR